jgi:hypothetical protein
VESEIARAAIETAHRSDETGHVLNIQCVLLESSVDEVGRPAGSAAGLRGVRPYLELIRVLPAITVRV